eukprot:121671_1
MQSSQSEKPDHCDEEEDKTEEDNVIRHMCQHQLTQNSLDEGTLKTQQTPLNLQFPTVDDPTVDSSSSTTQRYKNYAQQCQNQQCCESMSLTPDACPSLKRIRAVLEIYHKLTNDKSQWNAISTKKQIRSHKNINDDKYGHQQLFDDFAHLKLVHIDPDNKNGRHEFIARGICDMFKRDFPCDMKECRAFLYHYRDRGGQEFPDFEDTSFQQEFYKIHSYFFHSTIGYGNYEAYCQEQQEIDNFICNAAVFGSTRYSKAYDIDSDEKEILSEDDVCTHTYVGGKQDDAWWKPVKGREVDVTKRISKRDRDEIYTKLVSQIGVFRWQNPHGFKQKQSQAFLHHKPTFKNIKEEVLNNTYCKLSIKSWNSTLRSGEIFLKSCAGRQIRTKYRSFFEDNIAGHFEKWEPGERITTKEIVTLKLYTNFDKLQFQLKKCFRLETLEDILNDDEDDHDFLTR